MYHVMFCARCGLMYGVTFAVINDILCGDLAVMCAVLCGVTGAIFSCDA